MVKDTYMHLKVTKASQKSKCKTVSMQSAKNSYMMLEIARPNVPAVLLINKHKYNLTLIVGLITSIKLLDVYFKDVIQTCYT